MPFDAYTAHERTTVNELVSREIVRSVIILVDLNTAVRRKRINGRIASSNKVFSDDRSSSTAGAAVTMLLKMNN